MPAIHIELKTGSAARPLVDGFYEKHGSQSRARDPDLFFLAMSGQNLIGCVRYCTENATPLLRSMMIAENHRRKGIGARLLQAFCEFLDQNDIHNVFCLPYGHLGEFYTRMGFIQTAPESTPLFLAERLRDYSTSGKSYLCMRRS